MSKQAVVPVVVLSHASAELTICTGLGACIQPYQGSHQQLSSALEWHCYKLMHATSGQPWARIIQTEGAHLQLPHWSLPEAPLHCPAPHALHIRKLRQPHHGSMDTPAYGHVLHQWTTLALSYVSWYPQSSKFLVQGAVLDSIRAWRAANCMTMCRAGEGCGCIGSSMPQPSQGSQAAGLAACRTALSERPGAHTH